MREILFRAKRIDNGKWEFGSYLKHNNRQKCVIGDYDKPEDFDDLIIFSGFADWNMPRPLQYAKVDPETVSQFTGLIDKNGKKIFEGDICRIYTLDTHEEKLFTVGIGKCVDEYEFESVFYAVWVEWEGTKVALSAAEGFDEVEVIGNIYDNPELLEVIK